MKTIVILVTVCLAQSFWARAESNENEIPEKPRGYDKCMEDFNVPAKLDESIYGDWTTKESACAVACLLQLNGVLSKEGTIPESFFSGTKDGMQYKKPYDTCRNKCKVFKDNCELIMCVGEERKKANKQ